ncbi:hypothetical protein [Caudoviricetes sp.]|nr:hypothetical protein [Caudoviricetes sp.]
MADPLRAHHVTEPVTHYSPTANSTHPSCRVAVCGVKTRTAGPYRAIPDAAGVSRVELVTCCACADIIEARKKIEEAGA